MQFTTKTRSYEDKQMHFGVRLWVDSKALKWSNIH
jgi:hypothetical protein